MISPKNQLSADHPAHEPTGHHSFAQALNHLNKLTEELSDSLHRAINVARPHLVSDPRDVDKPDLTEVPMPAGSPVCHEVRAVNRRLEGLVDLLNRFGSNFDT